MILPASTVTPSSLAFVVSRGQSRNPEKRELESALISAASELGTVHVFDVPHLYDLKPHHEILDELRALEGDLVVASWLFPRATHWLLDRIGIQGKSMPTSFNESEESEESLSTGSEEPRVAELYPRKNRNIYCLDMRVGDAGKMIAEIQRLAAIDQSPNAAPVSPIRFEDPSTRRWYPVIDYSRCTNCMECIDFCLFGVYGLDDSETIQVEQQDNCRKGCPACSRVCPANAIIFPQHKAPAIAGADVEGDEGFKIDLSLLFGAPDNKTDAIEIAARERDEQLLLAGREAVGLPTLRSRAKESSQAADELDRLIDDLDRCDL